MSITLKLDNIEQVRSLYKKADAALQEVLKASCPEIFVEDVYARLRTFEACCFELGISPDTYNQISGETDEERSDRFYQRLKIIHRAFRNALNWTARLGDPNQAKYWVWLTDFKAGSGFSVSHCDNSRTPARVGSRLLLPDSKTALHVGKYFLSEFNGYQL